MRRKKRKVRKNTSTARDMLLDLETHVMGSYAFPPPYLHVAGSICNDSDLEKGFAGNYNLYARHGGHPDNIFLENWLCKFEGGARFKTFASGMGAISAAIFACGELYGPVHIVVILPIYGGTYSLLRKLARSPSHQYIVTFLCANEPNLPARLYDAIGPSTRAVIFEVGGNPTITIPDVENIVEVAHGCGREIITICDNTFHFGLFKPLTWGVDVEVGSGTKYLVGESSWLMGYCGVSPRFFERNLRFWKELIDWSIELGSTLGPFESWATGRFATKDLLDRVKLHSKNALAVAHFLETHLQVAKVNYPGLAVDSENRNACKYFEKIDGEQYFGGMISFDLKQKGLEKTKAFLYGLNNNTHIIHKASLGGPTDSVESPYILSHSGYDVIDLKRCGIDINTIRLSVGRDHTPLETVTALNEALYSIVQ